LIRHTNPYIYFALLIFALPSTAAGIQQTSKVLSTLVQSHPRIYAKADDFSKIRQLIKTDKEANRFYDEIVKKAVKILEEPASIYEKPDGRRLLYVSRTALDRISTLAFVYKISEDKNLSRSCAERAWKELDAVTSFSDWNPSHFLDTAEMAHAVGIGYDWLFDYLDQQQKRKIKEAVVELAFKPYEVGVKKSEFWMREDHNWNFVCNGGIAVAALALGDEVPDIAEFIVEKAIASVRANALKSWAPDGGWFEGPAYWSYSARYLVALIASLESAVGNSFDLTKAEGLSDACLFPVYLTGPFNRTFNFADAGTDTPNSAEMFWFAKRYNQPACSDFHLTVGPKPNPFTLIWFNKRTEPTKPLPLDKYYRNRKIELVTMRSSWQDPNGIFVGLKAGSNAVNHSNLDNGTFVLQAQGVYWATELGPGDYNAPGYFSTRDQRWNYYHTRAEGQNTIVINPGLGPDQEIREEGVIERHRLNVKNPFCIADITRAYAKEAQSVKRGAMLLDRKSLLLQDEIHAKAPSTVWWFMHTPAEIEINKDGRSAVLSKDERNLLVTLVDAPAEATLISMEANPLPTSPKPEKQKERNDVRKLALKLEKVENTRIAVLFTPLNGNNKSPSVKTKVRSLSAWR
jgi:hypothetical protein